jgi:L-rhamnose mutarotase
MRRVCFLLRVRPDLADDYVRRHTTVWPEMRAALAAAGWHNYSLFAAGDGQIVGYLETEDFDAALAAMERTDVNARWQAEMAPFFVGIDGRPDEHMTPLPEIFHLD